ncbi:nitrogenase [Methanocella sp. CWC-04]|uniref:Nitrogenase n=1 Tax=Methanooceanicella nereidis TaxID=2052831 RepID=A0AAP2RBI7_9EURY|nr:nitrogenase component 1 [Methanocella sp. CWC-04]MCD1294293.1 nitrogenase [Methanocella sp. CWC-04]
MSDMRAKMVSENQCQTCMPLGGVVAFKGIEEAMVLVHGSQGCSTYIRLSNVEHYNEPIDIASSALNEKQTIYGGEANLRKALDNVLRVYQPKVLGVVTTCLAETIGEDMERMIQSYIKDHDIRGVDIIPVATPSYSGSHTEGFWAATKEIIRHYARPVAKHSGINVIIPHISPADIREIKRILDMTGLEYTLIPDYSMTLDRPFGGEYLKIPLGGTRTRDISRMAGARATIQFGLTCPDDLSPGLYLQQEYGVPLIDLPLPFGLENTDRFIEALSRISGRLMPDYLALERGWLLDAMADSHKYNAEGHPVIYGEPELVYAFAALCAENGAMPAVIATGTRNGRLMARVKMLLAEAEEQPIFLEDADFTAIYEAAVSTGANVAIGHSGGKFLTEHLCIPVVRVGFPIHDRMGGQRILSAGYAGTLAFLDRFTNTLLERKYASYRQKKKDELTKGSRMQEAAIEGDE